MRRPSQFSELPPAPSGRSGWPWEVSVGPSQASANSGRWPRITIVTPSFNQGAFIEETIRSVLLQGYPNLQYIVIDGGSTDGTCAILEKYSAWLDYWESEPDRGQSHAINKGLARADGVWFNWLNSDDCLLPGALHSVAAQAAKSGAAIVGGYLQFGAELTQPRTISRVKLSDDPEDSLVHHVVCQPATFFRTDLVRELGGVRESLHYTMDLDVWLRAVSSRGPSSVALCDEPLAFFREHGASKTAQCHLRFDREERRLFRALAEASGLSPAVLDAIAPASDAVKPWPIEALDRPKLRARIVDRFVWNGLVELAWKRRDFGAFRDAIGKFRACRETPWTPRQMFLTCLAVLPDLLLAAASRHRTEVQQQRMA